MAGRATLGRAAVAKMADKDYMNNLREKADGGSWAARQQLKSLDARSKGSFDLRGNSLVGSQLKKTGIDFGKEGGKGGYDAVVKEREKLYESKGPRNTDRDAGDRAVRAHQTDVAQRRTEVGLLADEIKRQEEISASTFSSTAEKDAARAKAEELRAQMKAKQDKVDEMSRKKEDQIRKKAETDSAVERMERGMGKAGREVSEIEKEKEEVKAKIAAMWKNDTASQADKEIYERENKKYIDELTQKAAKVKLSADEIARRKQIAEIKKRGGKTDSERFIEELQEKAKKEAGEGATTSTPNPAAAAPTPTPTPRP